MEHSVSPSLLFHHEVAVHVVHAVVGRVGLDEIDVVAPEPLDHRVLILAVGPEWKQLRLMLAVAVYIIRTKRGTAGLTIGGHCGHSL